MKREKVKGKAKEPANCSGGKRPTSRRVTDRYREAAHLPRSQLGSDAVLAECTGLKKKSRAVASRRSGREMRMESAANEGTKGMNETGTSVQ